jgi:gamma-glutamylcyclotransferase (GGCT)/AIG2-like uncharacterized protein YtfP
MNNTFEYLFVYGTLMDSEMRKTLFDRDVLEMQAILKDYILKENDDFYFVSEKEGENVEGAVICLSENELLICDQWEEIPFYERIKVCVKIEKKPKEVWVYVRNITEGKKVVKNNASSLSRDSVINHITDFKNQLNSNKLPK